MKQNVLVLIKPEGMARGLLGQVLDRFLAEGMELLAIKTLAVAKDLVEEHYRHLKGKPFYQDLLKHLMGGYHGRNQVVAAVFSGDNAIKRCRNIAGATNPEEAERFSIRGRFGRITTAGVYENVVHVSSDAKEAKREIKLWFSPSEFLRPVYPEKHAAGKTKAWK